MSFTGPYPYGTPGGTEVLVLPQNPLLIRVAQGKVYILLLQVNGPIDERLRENVEDVVRVLGLTGQVLVAIIVRENGVVRDANATDLDFQDGLAISQIAPGVVTIDIGAGEVTTGMLADLSVTLIKLAANSVDASKIVDGSVGKTELAGAAIEDYIRGISASAGSGSNASTVTYVTTATQSIVLPAGTWNCTLLGILTATSSNATGTTFTDARVNINNTVISSVSTGAATGSGRHTVAPTLNGNVVSNGVAPTVFNLEFKANAINTAPSIATEVNTLIGICRRIL
jgi:hypothetical protein